MDEGVLLEQGRQTGIPPLKNVILLLLVFIVWKRLQLGTDMLLMIYQHRWPWTTLNPQKGLS